MPYIQLDMQGRARKEIADLYRWRYQNLKDLPLIENMREDYATTNPGTYLHPHTNIYLFVYICMYVFI